MIKYLHLIEHLETEAVNVLCRNLSFLKNQPFQIERVLLKYAALWKNNRLCDKITAFSGILINHFLSIPETIAAELRMHQTKKKERNMSIFISRLIWARQSKNRLEKNCMFVPKFLNVDEVLLISKKVEMDVQSFLDDQYEQWIAEVTIKTNDETLVLSGEVMRLDFVSGKLLVNYDDRLLALIREIRQLSSMGYKIPTRIQTVSSAGEKLFRYGVILKQIANFYNSIDQKIIPCQFGLLLKEALNFEQLAKSTIYQGKVITWDDIEHLNLFILHLQQSADVLNNANTRLRALHADILENVTILFNISIIQNLSRWKNVIRAVTSAINSSLDNEGLLSSATLPWRNHWDYQIRKCLEYQYVHTLECLHSYLPEIKTELVFSQSKLQLRPTIEELRNKYYREMKKIVQLPTNFKSLGNSLDLFSSMVDSPPLSLNFLYASAEKLFSNVIIATEAFQSFLFPTWLDIPLIIGRTLKSLSDWELSFRLIKEKGKESELLPTFVKVDCISISASSIKAVISDRLQAIFDILVSSFRNAINNHMKIVNEFCDDAFTLLAKIPENIRDISLASRRHMELSESKLDVQFQIEQVEAKNKLLKLVSGTGNDLIDLRSKWDRLEVLLQGHELMINDRVEVLKGSIESRINIFIESINHKFDQWKQINSSLDELIAMDVLHEEMLVYQGLESTRKQLIIDCESFEITQPNFGVLDLYESAVKLTLEIWNVRVIFDNELKAIMEENWILFRSKQHILDDFILTWSEKLANATNNPVVACICREFSSIKAYLPYLKALSGEDWVGEHWGEIYRILKLEKGVSVSSLKVRHFFAPCTQQSLITNINIVKELNCKATGEVHIRNALIEIDIWGASGTIVLSSYSDAKGNQLLIIAEWPKLFSSIGDFQSLIGSLSDSNYASNFADRISIWNQKLFELSSYFEQLNAIQRRWIFLEPILNRGAMPSEESRYLKVDKDFRSILLALGKERRVLSILSFHGIKVILENIEDQLERIQRALADFLEQKRGGFPRFYFLGDEDLLEMLGRADNPDIIQRHLKKLFAGVRKVIFDESNLAITAMESENGERVLLKHPITITGEIDKWLDVFTNEMKFTLQELLKECLTAKNIWNFPTQILALAEYINFTKNVEIILNSDRDFGPLLNDLKCQLNELTQFDSSIYDLKKQGVLDLRIKSLIYDVIHFIDVVNSLIASAIESIGSWIWQKQLRFYLSSSGNCVIRMFDSCFQYSYEYQGIQPKLVHTQLTDKCYLTLTQAMSSGFGGNPFGPAGTGIYFLNKAKLNP